MFANRFTVLLDACVLVPALKRNCLLSLAEAGFFRVRWSASILEETERAIVERLHQGGPAVSRQKAARVRQAMQTAFEDAMVTGYERLVEAVPALPDPNDAHVVAAAMKARAAVIVTDNIRHFPDRILGALDLEAKTADEFLADTVDLDTGRAVAAIRVMRERFRRPDLAAGDLLLKMQAAGLPQTTDILREHAHSL